MWEMVVQIPISSVLLPQAGVLKDASKDHGPRSHDMSVVGQLYSGSYMVADTIRNAAIPINQDLTLRFAVLI
jgi:hypothetical protein